MRKNSLFWGLVLVVLGGLFLLSNLGILRVNVWGMLVPALLILLGVWIIVGVTRKPSLLQVETASVDLEGIKKVSLTLHHGAGKLVLRSDSAIAGAITGNFSGGLEVKRTIDGAGARVELQPRKQSNPMWPFPWSTDGRGFDWDMVLGTDASYILDFQTGADDANIDLTGLRVSEFRLQTGASSTRVILPESAGYTRVKFEGGAADAKFIVPGGVAAQIHSQSGVSSIVIDQTRFPFVEGVYRSPNYEVAENKVDIEIQMGAGAVRVS